MNEKLKAFLLLIINLAVNGSLWLFVPVEYKGLAILAVNLIQVAIAYYDPTYTIAKLGISKQQYLGKAKYGHEIESA